MPSPSGATWVQRALDSGAAGTDASLPLVLRQHVLEPGRALVAAVQSLEEAWSREMATPLEAKLSERYALRQRILETGADSG